MDGFGFPWAQTRSWTNGVGYAQNGVNGSGWVDTYLPHLFQAGGTAPQIVQANSSSSPGQIQPNDAAAVGIGAVSNGLNARYYDPVQGSYQSRFPDGTLLSYNSANDTYTLIDGQGDTLVFDGFGATRPAAQQGELASFTDPAGQTMAVTAYTSDGAVRRNLLQRCGFVAT